MIAAVSDAAAFRAVNALVLRNTSFGNFFDLCSLSLPMPKAGMAAGLMLMAANGTDRALLSLGVAVEGVLRA